MSIKAEITDVKIGPFTIAGLMSENGEFGVAVPQVADLFEASRNTMSRDLKRLLGEDLHYEKWKTSLNQKVVNVILLKDFESLLFRMAQSGNAKAIEMWNQSLASLSPSTRFIQPKKTVTKGSIESKVEDFVMDLYKSFNPRRQITTDFGIADVVHDHGVVEIKEYSSVRSAHLALGQAMSYGSILNKQPEILLFNVPESSTDRIIRLFTAVGVIVLILSPKDTKSAVSGKLSKPTFDNMTEIQFQCQR